VHFLLYGSEAKRKLLVELLAESEVVQYAEGSGQSEDEQAQMEKNLPAQADEAAGKGFVRLKLEHGAAKPQTQDH